MLLRQLLRIRSITSGAKHRRRSAGGRVLCRTASSTAGRNTEHRGAPGHVKELNRHFSLGNPIQTPFQDRHCTTRPLSRRILGQLWSGMVLG